MNISEVSSPLYPVKNTHLHKSLCVTALQANRHADIYNSYKSLYGTNHKKQAGSKRKPQWIWL